MLCAGMAEPAAASSQWIQPTDFKIMTGRGLSAAVSVAGRDKAGGLTASLVCLYWTSGGGA